MKKNPLVFVGFALALVLVSLSCEKKKDEGIGPTYKENSGTGGNPFPNNQTVTGTSTFTNPATQNSNIIVGGSGWSNPSCASTASTTIKGINNSVEVTMNFSAPPAVGTFSYAIVANPTQPLTCSMNVLNAPNQPFGVVWYATSGIVTVNTTTNSINASFANIVCIQKTFNFPTVAITGNVGCN
jgi:hypothetical protein